jgi:hypothetical protein
MGQLIACATAAGLMLGTDSRAEIFTPAGEEQFLKVDRLVPVASHAVLASAGAVEGVELCKRFADFARDEQLTDIDALIEAAPPFFVGVYDEFLRKMCEKLPVDPLLSLYLVLAGFSAKTPDRPTRLFIMWNRVQPPKIESNQVTPIFTLPRRMGLEFKLNQMVSKNAPLAEIAGAARAGMEKLAAKDEFIGGPYKFITITAQGINPA